MISGTIAITSTGQERNMHFDFGEQGRVYNYSSLSRANLNSPDPKLGLQKTTAAPRWYSFSDYFNRSETDLGTNAAATTSYLWKDTMAVMAYSSTSGIVWEHNRMVSMGLVVDPSFSGFNSTTYYLGEMKINSTDAYSVDSIRFSGIYGFRPTNTYVDTIRVAFVYGNGDRGNGTSGPDVYLAKTGNTSVWANYAATDSMSTYRMHFDSVTTRTTGSSVVVKDLILDNTTSTPAWGDTLADGTFLGSVALSDVSIPAGNLIGATLTFISGSPSFVAHDTVFGSSVGYKHNMFRPFSIFRGEIASGAPAPIFAGYSASNRNSGMYKTLPDTAKGWGGQYIPLWFWTSGSGASTLQYPDIDFRIKCTTCGVVVGVNDVVNTISRVQAYPNPAAEELNVQFAVTGNADVSVTLSNVIGQVVATRNFGNVLKGKATFDTRTLPPGVYVCTVSSGGERYTSRVAVSH